MTLDETIAYYEEIAKSQDMCAEISVSEYAKERITKCATEHREVVEWLKELKEAREILRSTADFFARVETEKDCFIRVPCEECPLYNEKNDLCRWKYADAVKRLIE